MFAELQFAGGVKDKGTENAAGKIEWLRSQVIGQYFELGTPFGKRCLTYADHTASGRALHFIENFIANNVLPTYGNTHTDDSFVGRTTGYLMAEAHKYLKKCMGGTQEDALIFCGSGCTAAIKRLQEVMGIAIPSMMRDRVFNSLAEHERWVVFVGPYEHHSNLLTWRNSLAEVVEIPLSKDGVVDMETLKEALQNPVYKGRPKLGSFSAGSNVTGILTNTRSIARLLHAHGAFCCFDFAACAPYVKIDMRSGKDDGYDAIFVSPHKFMGGPGTPGILLMNKDLYLLKDATPSTCAGGTVEFVNLKEQNTIYLNDIEHREDGGTPAIVQKIRTALVYTVKEFLTTELIESRESFLIEAAIARLSKNSKINILGLNSTARRTSIMSFLTYTNPRSDYSARDVFGSSPLVHAGKWSVESRPKSPLLRASSDDDDQPTKGSSNPFSQFIGARNGGRARSDGAKPLPGRFIVTLLNDLFGIQARGGCSCAGPYGLSLMGIDEEESLAIRREIQKGYEAVKPGWARVSFVYYLSNEEFEFILSAIEFVAEFGERFLGLYSLNWKTGDWTFKPHSSKIRVLVTEMDRKKKKLQLISCAVKNGFRQVSPVDAPSIPPHEYNKRLSTYLEQARALSAQLPEVYPPRKIPKDLNQSLIWFSI